MGKAITETSPLAICDQRTGKLVDFDELAGAVYHSWWGGPLIVGEWSDDPASQFEEFYDLRKVVELTGEPTPSGRGDGSYNTVVVLTAVKTGERIILGDLRVVEYNPGPAIERALEAVNGLPDDWERELLGTAES